MFYYVDARQISAGIRDNSVKAHLKGMFPSMKPN